MCKLYTHGVLQQNFCVYAIRDNISCSLRLDPWKCDELNKRVIFGKSAQVFEREREYFAQMFLKQAFFVLEIDVAECISYEPGTYAPSNVQHKNPVYLQDLVIFGQEKKISDDSTTQPL